jgi:hypothetical protein
LNVLPQALSAALIAVTNLILATGIATGVASGKGIYKKSKELQIT